MGRQRFDLDGEQLRRCAQAVYDKDLKKKRAKRGQTWTPDRKERRTMLSRAYAICTRSLQDKGYLKSGTHTPTPKGRLASWMKSMEPEGEQRAEHFEQVLTSARALDLDTLMQKHSSSSTNAQIDLDALMVCHQRRHGTANYDNLLVLPGKTASEIRAELQPLRDAMEQVFRCKTAYGTCNAQVPSAGHCILAAMVVQDLFGGDLIEGSFRRVPHYWNRVAPFEIDLTGDQFGCAQVRVKRGRLNGGGKVFHRGAGQQLNQVVNRTVCGKHDTFVLALLPVLAERGLDTYTSRIARCQVGFS